jgi:hypothetical protein
MYWLYSEECGGIWKAVVIVYLIGIILVFRPIGIEANYEYISQDRYSTPLNTFTGPHEAVVWSPLPGSNLGPETEKLKASLVPLNSSRKIL